jgi:flagella basal body P-ring formation protein FlgA
MSRTVALWVSVALLLGVALGAIPTFLIFHGSKSSSTEPGTVLVAKRLIPKGTSGSSIAAQNLFVVVTVPKVQIAPRAISDPAVLQGRVSAADIYPREQLATSDFTTPH